MQRNITDGKKTKSFWRVLVRIGFSPLAKKVDLEFSKNTQLETDQNIENLVVHWSISTLK